MKGRTAAALALLLAAALGWYLVWSGHLALPRLLRPLTPHERYAKALADAGLAETALARDWLRSAELALASPIESSREKPRTFSFAAAEPRALGLRYALRRGQRFSIDVIVDGPASRVFIDLFELRGDGPPRRVASASEGAASISLTIRRDGQYVVRVQPELLRTVKLAIDARATASLLLPVEGVTPRNIRSVFGDPRDGGRRRHEGIDIFAPRGTPVRAASGGIVTTVSTSALGGNVVWIWNPELRESHYYAHLATQAVSIGARVRAGDVIGTVGNTGNARSTPPHLHFGIYSLGEGAVDPLPYVAPADA